MVDGYIPKYFTGRLHDTHTNEKTKKITAKRDATTDEIMKVLTQAADDPKFWVNVRLKEIDTETHEIKKIVNITKDSVPNGTSFHDHVKGQLDNLHGAEGSRTELDVMHSNKAVDELEALLAEMDANNANVAVHPNH